MLSIQYCRWHVPVPLEPVPASPKCVCQAILIHFLGITASEPRRQSHQSKHRGVVHEAVGVRASHTMPGWPAANIKRWRTRSRRQIRVPMFHANPGAESSPELWLLSPRPVCLRTSGRNVGCGRTLEP